VTGKALAYAKRLHRNGQAQADVEVGDQGEPAPMVPHQLWDAAVEVKSHKRSTPKNRAAAWEQAVKSGEKSGKRPLLIETYVTGGRREYWLIQKLSREGATQE
jgi:hypothetical protein